MNTPMSGRIGEASPRFQSSIAVVFYLVTILMGGIVLFMQGSWGLVVDLTATACYVAVTALFYRLSR